MRWIGLAVVLGLGVAADEARETSSRGCLKPRARGADTRKVVDLDGRWEAFHWDWAERLHIDETLDKIEYRLCQEHAARPRELFHPRRQMRRFPDRGVIHPQIAADCAHDHLVC